MTLDVSLRVPYCVPVAYIQALSLREESGGYTQANEQTSLHNRRTAPCRPSSPSPPAGLVARRDAIHIHPDPPPTRAARCVRDDLATSVSPWMETESESARGSRVSRACTNYGVRGTVRDGSRARDTRRRPQGARSSFLSRSPRLHRGGAGAGGGAGGGDRYNKLKETQGGLTTVQALQYAYRLPTEGD